MQQRSWVLSSLLCAVGILSAAPARADMRCNGKIVSTGDQQYQVKNLCGSPDQTTQRVEQRAVRRWVQGPCVNRGGQVQCGYMEEQVVQVTVEDWVYDLGPHSLVRFLTFEQGTLVRVTTGGYGTKEI